IAAAPAAASASAQAKLAHSTSGSKPDEMRLRLLVIVPLALLALLARVRKVVEAEARGRAVAEINHRGGADRSGDADGFADLLFGRAERQRLLDVPVNAAFALGDERCGNRDQLLHFRIEHAPLRR